MDTAAAVLEIAVRDGDPAASTLPAHIAAWHDDESDADFLDWLDHRKRMDPEAIARLRSDLRVTIFRCLDCQMTWRGGELQAGRPLRCPTCGGGLSISETAGLMSPPAAIETRVEAIARQRASAVTRQMSMQDYQTSARHVVDRQSAPPTMPVLGPDDDPVVRPTGRWTVIEPVGSGAMGDVWKAYNGALDQFTAVKVLSLTDDVSIARFQSEAKTYGRLDHPNIVRVRDIGQFGERPAIMLEWVDGGSLEGPLNDGVLYSVRDVLQIAQQVTSALGAAHAVGIIHRDVKPANLLRTSGGTIKVTDFGLALVGNARMTAAGVVLGTPAYISPEQVAFGTATAASDIYSLGATLFHLLVGHPPFPGPGVVAMMSAHVTRPFPSVGKSRPGTPIGVDQLLRDMTSKDPAARPDGPAVLLRLAALLDALPDVDAAASWSTEECTAVSIDFRPGVEMVRVNLPPDRDGWLDLAQTILARVEAGASCVIADVTECEQSVSMSTVTILVQLAGQVGAMVTIALVADDERISMLLDGVGARNLQAYPSVDVAIRQTGSARIASRG